ncbi:hypothetical protein [Moraxella nonliquefaciens]|jgi:hypothetical protein|nr:hypothetical protein [Moraxella nonliquefaciens]
MNRYNILAQSGLVWMIWSSKNLSIHTINVTGIMTHEKTDIL